MQNFVGVNIAKQRGAFSATSVTFATTVAVPLVHKPHRVICSRVTPFAKKRGGKKRAKSTGPQSATPASNKPVSAPSAYGVSSKNLANEAKTPIEESLSPGPIAREPATDEVTDVLSSHQVMSSDIESFSDSESSRSIAPEDDSFAADDAANTPVENEARLRLPDLPQAGPRAVKRKRKPRASVSGSGAGGMSTETRPTGDVTASKSREPLPSHKVRELTAAYRMGGKGAELLMDELEKDPDFMLQTGNPEGEYDLTSAIIGTGRPNRQGLYLLPYLQSGHVLLLLVVLLCTFVYYPGFPLTELEDSVRTSLKKGLALTYFFNSVLAVLAFTEAQKRRQPAAFWAFKTAFLGNLALNELKGNAPLQESKVE